jgi:F-type H+-transporting ATPase subunit a
MKSLTSEPVRGAVRSTAGFLTCGLGKTLLATAVLSIPSLSIASDHGAEHALPPSAPILFHLGPLPVSNSMVLMWVVAFVLVGFARVATRQMESVPSGAQNFLEWIVETLRNFLEGVVGRALAAKTFWFFATAFIFILTTNWFGLIPGVGTVGYGVPDADGSLGHIARPLLRGVNADLNMTLAMAMIFFFSWTVWAVGANGVWGTVKHLFAPRGKSEGIMKALMLVVFLAVGVLEVVSIVFRPVSLSFRLYGNIFAGETMLEAISNLVPALAPVLPLPFYFMELLVGFVQAFVFMLLTAVFTFLICDHGDGHAEGGHHE